MAVLALALLGLWLAPGPASASAQLSEPASLLDTPTDPVTPAVPAVPVDTPTDPVTPAVPADPVDTPTDPVAPAVPADPVDTPTDPVTPAVPADPVDTPTDPVTPDPGQTLPLDPSVDGPATPAQAPPSGSVAPVLPGPPSSLQESQLTVFPSPVGPPRPVSSPPGGAAAGVHATLLGKAASFGDAIGAAYPPPRTLAALPSAAMGDMHPAADAPAAPPNGRRPAPEPPRSPQAPGGPSVGGGPLPAASPQESSSPRSSR